MDYNFSLPEHGDRGAIAKLCTLVQAFEEAAAFVAQDMGIEILEEEQTECAQEFAALRRQINASDDIYEEMLATARMMDLSLGLIFREVAVRDDMSKRDFIATMPVGIAYFENIELCEKYELKNISAIIEKGPLIMG